MDDEDRWAEARRRANALHDRIRPSANLRAIAVILLSAFVFGTLSATVNIVLLSHDTIADAGTGAAPSAWFWTGLTLVVAGLIAALVVLIRGLVSGRLVILSRRVETPLSWRQKRTVSRVLRRRELPEQNRLPVIRAIAEQRVQLFRGLLPAYVSLEVFIIGATIAFADAGIELPLLFGGLGALAALTVAIDTMLQVRPARHFLQLNREG